MVETRNPPLPKIVSADEWHQSLAALRQQEKELTRQGDKVSATRRRLPMVKMDKNYLFTNPAGEKVTFLHLFGAYRQLIVYHFMYAPDWDQGCAGCSWVVDAMSHPAHLNARDAALVLISRADIKKLETYRVRMGWEHPWYSSSGSDFNADCGATNEAGEEIHGVSIFLRHQQDIYRTYYTGARGVEHLGSHWTYLDLLPYGRQEEWEDSPPHCPQGPIHAWMRRHDDY